MEFSKAVGLDPADSQLKFTVSWLSQQSSLPALLSALKWAAEMDLKCDEFWRNVA